MRVTQTIETGAGVLTVKELTVGEVRRWLAEVANGIELPADVIGNVLFEGFSLFELALFLDTPPDYDALTQSEVRALDALARQLNPDFFRFRQRLFQVGKVAEKTGDSAASPISS